MAITANQNTNPHNNTAPVVLNNDNYTDPITLATEMQARQGLPKEMLDQVFTDCENLVKDSWLGFLDMFQMNVSVRTKAVNFIETETPDYVIDDDGAVARALEVFTIDWTKVQGHATGEDSFFFRVNDTIMVVDDVKREIGVITAVNKSANTFTAKTRNGSAWTIKTSNLSIDVLGSDHDRGSCGPEGLMELRKRKSRVLNLVVMKDAIKASAGKRFAFQYKDEVKWYDDNTVTLMKRLNKKIAKTLMLDIESKTGSAALAAGKHGTQGLFDNLEENGLLHTGYIDTVAALEAITTYWDGLGYSNKEFIAHVDTIQYRHLEVIAGEIAKAKGVELHVILDNKLNNYSQFGFTALNKDGYTIYFSKWSLTTGNSPFGKKRIKDQMPKGIIMPMGTVETVIEGRTMQVPYIFKVYLDDSLTNPNAPAGMMRTFLSGGYNGDGDCEYSKITKSTTVGIACVVPEAITLIK
ncbi:structural protein [Tenacibaculum phage Gundel_1]|uniref:Structural protein n=1 Tax=Tenacibaculum phage Gundel_1 TaxID=2745672 RepID=A0A8E4ZM83_9CAUD|nr:structural protein [Tenacibaculum phage Gundel_1]QQV91489.1 structural protein [Tenacibaculum phage Gundel_1]